MYSLHKQGPCTVYSGDLEPVNGDAALVIPETSVPIVKLAEGQLFLFMQKQKWNCQTTCKVANCRSP